MTTVCSYSTTNHSAYMDYSFRHANSAGQALPHIPRRTSHTRSPAVSPPMTQVLTPSRQSLPVARVVVQPPSPPDARVDQQPVASTSAVTSSSSGSDTFVEIAAPKARRPRLLQRGPIPAMLPPEQSTPTPAFLVAKALSEERVPFPVHDDTPRASSSSPFLKQRPGIMPLTTLNPASNSMHPRSASVTLGAIGRKKTGEPLKSSLKSRRPTIRGDLTVLTGPLSSRSEPSTPTHIKSVHFDTQLEHVKLFLAEQKPLAVSRDGSPTDDTSGTETEFPAFIYGGAEQEKKGKLKITMANMREEREEDWERWDAKLEKLELSEDGMTATGCVRVRNIAFEKWVAVRFTFDWWQTTSEVAAKYVESVRNGAFDRFQFSIRLNDMINRIEDKTMFMAVKYTSAGREIWDNNGGQNYRVTFSREPVPRIQLKTVSDEAGKASGIADLKSKLEQVATNDEGRATVGGFLSARTSRARSLSPPGPRSGYAVANDEDDDEDDRSFTLKSNKPLSSRYDFAVSLKSPWRRSAGSDATPPASGFTGDRPRTSTYPNAMPHFPRRAVSDKSALLTSLARGSPRIFDTDDDLRPGVQSHYANSDLEETPVPAATRKPTRNHQRGYFDLGVAASAYGVRRTPPGSPFDVVARSPSSSGRTSPVESESGVPVVTSNEGYTVPKLIGGHQIWRVPSGGSEDSTPSSMSNDESSRSSSPDGSPFEGPISLDLEDGFPRSPSPDDRGSYDAFLNRCVATLGLWQEYNY
jgi:hypothetical protein